MLGHSGTLLHGMVTAPTTGVSALRLLTEVERPQQPIDWKDTAVTHPHHEETIAELFEAQAARSPEAIAVVHEDEQVTYAQLNARANQLAHHLWKLGVGPDVQVGDRKSVV